MHRYYRVIRLADTDAAGVVYFAQILSLCHEGYEDSLDKLGVNLKNYLDKLSAVIPIVHADIDYYKPMFWGDRVVIELKPIQLSVNSFEIDYQILTDNPTPQQIAVANTKHVCINSLTRKRIALPESMVQWLRS